LLIAASSSLTAQQVDLVADVVQFRSVDGLTRWEFQYAFPDTTLTYSLTPAGFLGELFCTLRVVSPLQDTVIDQWIASAMSKDRVPTHKVYHSGIRRLFLKPGRYAVELTVRDLHNEERTLTSSFTSSVRNFGTEPSLSDVMFTGLSVGAVDTTFMRNGVDAVPNPRHECLGTDPVIGVYAEIYNARSNGLDTFVVEYQVVDNVRREMMTSYDKFVAVDDGLVIREDIPAGALRSGVYSLRISIMDLAQEKRFATSEDRFYILNPQLPPEGEILLTEEQKFLASEWAVKVGEALELELELTNILATPGERLTRDELQTDRAKQRFLFKFWQMRDPDPQTMANERLDEFRRMFDRANKLYSTAQSLNGWRSDRGRVLLKYGRPTQEEIYEQTMDTKPYEVWFYQQIQGGARFYFVDWQVMQNHRLVHSTVLGEVRDDNWFDRYARAFTPDVHKVQDVLPSAR
jgi:GWxTD domain-containing protein